MKFEDLQEKVLEWADDRDLLYPENANKQFMKFMEEVFEFRAEMNTCAEMKLYKESDCSHFIHRLRFRKMKTEMGDVFVTLIILCEQLGIDPMDCLQMAYDKIKDRKGKTINGTFYKQEDL